MTHDLPTSTSRWVAVGSAADADPRVGGAANAKHALRGRANAKLLIVFTSEAFATPALLAGIGDRAPGVPLIGCSTAGEISGDAGDAPPLRRPGRRPAGGHPRGVRRLGAGVPLVGGCPGDGFKMAGTHQFHGDQVLRGAVVGAMLAFDAPFGVGVSHGWAKVGEPIMVTRSAGDRVYELDDRPALDVYLERLGAPEAARRDAAAFAEFGILHPLALDRRSGEPAVRFVAGADFEERSLTMIAEVPQGGLAWSCAAMPLPSSPRPTTRAPRRSLSSWPWSPRFPRRPRPCRRRSSGRPRRSRPSSAP